MGRNENEGNCETEEEENRNVKNEELISTTGLATKSICSVSFLYKIIDLPGGQINDPHQGNTILFRSLQGPSTRLMRCFRNYRDTRTPSGVPRTLSAEVPGHSQQQLTQTLIVRLLKTHFFTSILDFEKSTE